MTTVTFPKEENLEIAFSDEEKSYVAQVIRTQILKINAATLALVLVIMALMTSASPSAYVALLLPATPLFLGIVAHGFYRLNLFLKLRHDHKQFLRRYGRLY